MRADRPNAETRPLAAWRQALLAAVCLFPLAGEVLAEEIESTESSRALKMDRYGQPLPPGAIARLGNTRLLHSTPGISAVAFFPDGKRLASLSRGGELCVWEVATGRELVQVQIQGARAMAVCPRSGLIAVFAGGLLLCDPESGEIVFKEEVRSRGRCQFLRFSPDGGTLAGGGFGDVVLWSIRDREAQLFRTELEAHGASDVALSADGIRLAACGGSRGGLAVWELDGLREEPHAEAHLDSEFSCVAFFGKDQVIAARIDRESDRGALAIYDAASLEHVRDLATCPAMPLWLEVSPDRNEVWVCDSKLSMHCFDLKDGTLVRTVQLGSLAYEVVSVLAVRNGDLLALGTWRIDIWNVPENTELSANILAETVHFGWGSLATTGPFSPGGKYVFVGGTVWRLDAAEIAVPADEGLNLHGEPAAIILGRDGQVDFIKETEWVEKTAPDKRWTHKYVEFTGNGPEKIKVEVVWAKLLISDTPLADGRVWVWFGKMRAESEIWDVRRNRRLVSLDVAYEDQENLVAACSAPCVGWISRRGDDALIRLADWESDARSELNIPGRGDVADEAMLFLSPQGKYAAALFPPVERDPSRADSCDLFVWETATARRIAKFPLQLRSSGVRRHLYLSVSDDGGLCAMRSPYEELVRILDPATGKEVRRYDMSVEQDRRKFLLSDDAERIAPCRHQRFGPVTVGRLPFGLWDGICRNAAMSRDGTLGAYLTADGKINVLRVPAGELVQTCDASSLATGALLISPLKNYLLVRCRNASTIVWPLAPLDEPHR